MPNQNASTTFPAPGERYRIPSGLGGSFDVRVHEVVNGVADVRIDEPRNPDWNGHPMKVAVVALRPIPVRFEIRTRIGKTTGLPDDFLRWSTVDTREEAEEQARQASNYPQCHPVKIVPVEG